MIFAKKKSLHVSCNSNTDPYCPLLHSLEVGDLTKKINDLLVQFAAPSSVGDRDKYGCDIYNELVEFSGNIRKELDGNIFG
jgi:hypothetical protein